MADRQYVKGATGLVSVKDTTAYKPVVCLTSSSLSQTLEVLEKVSMCSGGKRELSAGESTGSLSVSAYVMVPDSEANSNGYEEMLALYKAKKTYPFKLMGRGEPKYFEALITSISDTYDANDDATFDFTADIQGDISDTEPTAP